jgi:hypothetical protein
MLKGRIHSLSEIDSGWIYGAHYVRHSPERKQDLTRGPYYEWYPDSSLYHRSYSSSASSQSRYYDRQGNLRVYDAWVRGSGCTPGNSSHELFSAEGALVGCVLPRLKKHYWMGREVEPIEFIHLQGKFYKWE